MQTPLEIYLSAIAEDFIAQIPEVQADGCPDYTPTAEEMAEAIIEWAKRDLEHAWQDALEIAAQAKAAAENKQ